MFVKQNMPPEYVNSVTVSLTPNSNGGEAVMLTVDYFIDKNNEIFSTTQLTLNSYGNQSTFNFSFGIDDFKKAIEKAELHAPSTTTKNFMDVINNKIKADPVLAKELGIASRYTNLASMVYQGRTKAGLSQKELANCVGLREIDINNIEDSDCEYISIESIMRVAQFLNLDLLR